MHACARDIIGRARIDSVAIGTALCVGCLVLEFCGNYCQTTTGIALCVVGVLVGVCGNDRSSRVGACVIVLVEDCRRARARVRGEIEKQKHEAPICSTVVLSRRGGWLAVLYRLL